MFLDWLVFCDCGFQSVSWKLPDGRDWLRVEPWSLIQFSAHGWSCILSLLFTWGQVMVEIMKTMVTFFKHLMHVLLHSVPPTLQQATTDPHFHWTLTDKSESVSCRVTTPFICIHEDHYVNGMFSPPTKLKTTTWEEVNWCIAPHNPHCPSIKGPGGGNFHHLTYYVYFTLLTVLTL